MLVVDRVRRNFTKNDGILKYTTHGRVYKVYQGYSGLHYIKDDEGGTCMLNHQIRTQHFMRVLDHEDDSDVRKFSCKV